MAKHADAASLALHRLEPAVQPSSSPRAGSAICHRTHQARFGATDEGPDY